VSRQCPLSLRGFKRSTCCLLGGLGRVRLILLLLLLLGRAAAATGYAQRAMISPRDTTPTSMVGEHVAAIAAEGLGRHDQDRSRTNWCGRPRPVTRNPTSDEESKIFGG
jgi:hypothetical protein